MARRLDRRYAHLTAVYNRKISNRSLSGTERSQLDIWSCRFCDRCSSLGLLLIVDIFSRRRVHAGVRNPIRIRRHSCEKRRAYREQKKRNATTGKAHWRPYQPRRLPRKRHRLNNRIPESHYVLCAGQEKQTYDVEVAAGDDASWSILFRKRYSRKKRILKSSREQIENPYIDLSVQESEPL